MVAAVALLHFFVPFVLLLFRNIKRQVVPLATIAWVIFLLHLVNTYWLIMPSLHQHGLVLSWLDVAAPVGVGGLWIAVFLSRLKAVALLPLHDPGLQFAFTYGH
jgi:hypothetical protein